MAIERVGGSKVYVIRGSGRDPRLTSTGQSWANLVTQQKKILWQEAQKQALQEIRYEEMNVQQKQQVQSELKRQLNTQIRDTTKSIQRLEVGEIESAQAIKERLVYTQNLNSRRYSTGGTQKVDPLQKTLQKNINKQYSLIGDTEKQIEKVDEDIFNLSSQGGMYVTTLAAQNAVPINEKENEKDELKERLQEHKDERDKLVLQRSNERSKQEEKPFTKVTSGGGVSGTSGGGAEAVSTTPIDFSDQIKKLENQRKILQDELKELITLENTKPDLIDRTRGIYYDKFGNAPANLQLPEPKRLPRAETLELALDDLGSGTDFTPIEENDLRVEESIELDQNNINEFADDGPLDLGVGYETFETVNQYVRKNFTDKIRNSNMSTTFLHTFTLEMLRDLHEKFPKETKRYEEIREGIIKAWEIEANPIQEDLVRKGKFRGTIKKSSSTEKFQERSTIRDLVSSLYAPSTIDKEKRQEAFNNAVIELEKHYKNNPDELEEAKVELISIQEEGSE